jgi:hypothetical protein
MILAAGCSIAHGQGTVVERYDLENCKFSFPNLIADKLGVICNNIAYPANSNEEIFHNVLEELDNNSYTYCLVSWTSLSREIWKTSTGRWAFNLNYASYYDNDSFDVFVDRLDLDNVVSTDKHKLKLVRDCLNAFKIKVINDDFETKLRHYKSVLSFICNNKGIKLLQIDAIKNDNTSNLYLLDPKLFKNPRGSELHPPRESHEFWANDMFEKFYAK